MGMFRKYKTYLISKFSKGKNYPSEKDWKRQYLIREYYKDQEDEPDCPVDDCFGVVETHSEELSGPHNKIYSCNNPYGCKNHIHGKKIHNMIDYMQKDKDYDFNKADKEEFSISIN